MASFSCFFWHGFVQIKLGILDIWSHNQKYKLFLLYQIEKMYKKLN